ncbi:YihY/virulence factor BrkB family protein [Longimicrobium sp.]|uniref:YihY/virulence factor BrkB family protein n=1 Tax=Longimicrobium sp. TaxID=2029185 RepID=UPI002CF6E49D|nr:YihY/virulence factor BrkB family protein [Longimicrobium sp.]HSU12833.1 YihY/virulence factor BrkB family protein [Longimicrobium sp.]
MSTVERRRWMRRVNVPRAAVAALARFARYGGDFVGHLYRKAGEDEIFFLAGGIAFDVLFAAVPFLLMLVGIFGIVLARVVTDPRKAAVDYIVTILPPTESVVRRSYQIVDAVLAGRTSFGVVGLVLFLWISSRLIATLRTSLKEIFDLPEERGIVEGKVFDLQMMLVAGTLFVANTGITVILDAAQNLGVRLIGTRWIDMQTVQLVWARLLAFLFIFLMFLLIYRYLPKRRTPWRMAMVAAVFTSLAWELLKGLFAIYVLHAGSWQQVYGVLVTPIILVLWIYYSAVVFILGGEIAHVYDLMRMRRLQRELLE